MVDVWVKPMADHGHNNCPHCEHELNGKEPVCPKCEGGLFGVPPKKTSVKEKATGIATKIKAEVKDGVSAVSDKSGQTFQKVSQTIGEHVVPAWSTVAQTSSDIVDKVKDKALGVSNNDLDTDEKSPSNDDTLTDTSTNNPNSIAMEEGDMDIDELLSKGELLVSEGREQQALKIFNSVIAEDPSNGMAWFNRGVIHEMSGDVDEALKSFKVCIDMQPDHGPAAANLAVLLDRTGSTSEASRYAQLGLLAFPSHSELSSIVAKAPDEPAHQSAQIAAEPEPSPPPSQPVIETVAEPTPEPVIEMVAEPTPEPVIEMAVEPEIDVDDLVAQAAELVKQNQPEDALELLRDTLHGAASEHPRAWRIAAASMAQLSMIESAIEAFTYALDLDNTDAPSWYNLGALHKRNGHEESAVACYDAALGLRPEYSKAAAALAEIHTANGHLTAAIDAWRALLAHQPNHAGGTTFAEILVAIGEGEGEVLEMATEIPTTIPEGPELASEALKYIPDDDVPSNITLRARALTLTGSYPEAIKAWRALIETDRDNSNLWEGMMKTFVSAGDQTTAEKCRQKIASLSGDPQSITDANAAPHTSLSPEPEVAVDEPESAPAEVIEATEPQPEPEEQVVGEESWDNNPWGEDTWGGDDETNVEEAEGKSDDSAPAPAEIVAAEATLDTVPEPEPTPISEPSPEVDLAKVALDTQAQSESRPVIMGEGKIDSSSIANQDVQWYNKGLSLLADDKYQEALSCFDRALPTFVDDDEMIVRILNARGNTFYYLKQFSECIEAYHKAMQVNPTGVTGATLYNMGTAYAEVERYDDGIKCFEQGMSSKRVNPLNGEQAKMAKEQIRRCKILLKEQQKKLKRFAKLQS